MWWNKQEFFCAFLSNAQKIYILYIKDVYKRKF